MARQARLVEAGTAFHVTARGNYRQRTFHDAEDRAEYVALLARYSALEGVAVVGWCLMTNHVHLIGVPGRAEALARVMKRTQSDYAQRLNRRHGRRCGHLWQSRFYSCPVDGDGVWAVLRYIELNPVRAGVVSQAEQSDWSSAPIHCGLQAEPALLSVVWWREQWTPERWRSVLAHGVEEREMEAIRQATQHGVPLGASQFVAHFERQAGRDLSVRPVGRPRVTLNLLPSSSDSPAE
jgi:putative transposase